MNRKKEVIRMQIRIVPMSTEDVTMKGKTYQEIQQEFFQGYLKEEGKGWYYYGKHGLEADAFDLLLFQMENRVIASAVLDQVLSFPTQTEEGNKGAFILDQKTIKTFKPIEKEELSTYIPSFSSFNQAKQKFSKEEVHLEKLEERMNLQED